MMTRRAFLLSSGATVVAFGDRFTGPTGGHTGSPTLDEPARALVESVFVGADADATRRVGSAYLRATPKEADLATLTARLTPSRRSSTRWWSTATPESFRSEMQQRIRGDFAAGRVVDLEGWVFSRSGARLAALWVVTHPRR